MKVTVNVTEPSRVLMKVTAEDAGQCYCREKTFILRI